MIINPYSFGGGPSLWTPSQMGSLYAWFVGDDAGNTISGGEVTAMVDKSGNGYTAVKTGSPTNSGSIDSRTVPYINSDTDGYVLHSSSVGFSRNRAGVTLACVYEMDPDDGSSTERALIFSDTNSANTTRIALHSSGGGAANRPQLIGRRLDANSIQKVQSPGAYTSAAVAIGIADYANSNAYLRMNGSLAASTTSWHTDGNTSDTASASFVHLCRPQSGDSHRGPVGEWVLCTSALSDSDAEKLEGYLAWQWGLEGSLPGGHPYKSAAPTL